MPDFLVDQSSFSMENAAKDLQRALGQVTTFLMAEDAAVLNDTPKLAVSR